MSSTKPSRTMRAMAWDPKSPATLLLPTVDSTSATRDGAFRLDMFLSHDGVGCNSHESSALMNILDAHETYLSGKTGSWKSLKALSTAYRKALWNCLRGWEEGLANTDNGGDGDGDDDLELSRENLELLKIIYAVAHLSEVFLLLPPSNSALDYYEHTAFMPGAVTADLVRYLRFHHMSDAYASVEPDPNVLEEVLESMHPDQAGGDGALYWKLVETLLIRGCLEDVWSLLSRHSIFRRSVDTSVEMLDEYHATTLNEDREGFFALRAILLSAPLPGGRKDLHDAAFDHPGDENDDDQAGGEDDELLEGIPLSGYRMWETGRMDSGESATGDLPHSFNPHAASQMFQTWTQHLNALTAVHKLKRRIPQIEMVLSILSGNLKNVVFESWAENFCAELLYKLRTLRPDDMHARASRIMEKFGVTLKGSIEEVVLSVMKGNAGRVVDVVFNLGGGSGAALPSVMTALLCDLLTEAKVMPTDTESHSLQTELLLNAAFAIQSSEAAEGHHDLGARLAIRLLLPYAKPDGDLRVTATIGEILEHHTPGSDAEARTLLSLCRTLVERKSVRVLDGCVSIALSRYRYYLADQRPGGAVHWLVTGMELESLVLCGSSMSRSWQRDLSCGVCYRMLVTRCLETAQLLLKGILGEREGAALVYSRASEMVKSGEESKLVAFVPPVKVLSYVVGMAGATVERKDESIVASNIVSCLKETPSDEDDGVVSALAPTSMHWDLLRLAHRVLDRNTNRNSMEGNQMYSSAFDVRGMQVLLERFTVIMATREVERLEPISKEEVHNMRLALANGLMTAFVAENAKKNKIDRIASAVSVAGICAADLGKHSRDQQEKIVELMLDI